MTEPYKILDLFSGIGGFSYAAENFFQGQFRGIPVTSVVGVLNDDFEGGEFRFWKEHTVNIKKGSVLVFPALYLFPHEVTPVTKGVRYSWISWIV